MDGMVPNRLPAIKTFVDAMNIAWYALVVVPHNIESRLGPHFFACATRADRNYYLGDADFVDVPRGGLVNMTYSTQRRDEFMRVAVRTPETSCPCATLDGE